MRCQANEVNNLSENLLRKPISGLRYSTYHSYVCALGASDLSSLATVFK